MKRWSDKVNLLSRTEYNNAVDSLTEIHLWFFCLQDPHLISNLSSQNMTFLQRSQTLNTVFMTQILLKRHFL